MRLSPMNSTMYISVVESKTSQDMGWEATSMPLEKWLTWFLRSEMRRSFSMEKNFYPDWGALMSAW